MESHEPGPAPEDFGSRGADALKGAVAGAAAWWVMDRVLRRCYNGQAPETRRREDEARGGVPALEVMAERLAGLAGVGLSTEDRPRAGTVLQWTVGIGMGTLYGLIRDRFPA